MKWETYQGFQAGEDVFVDRFPDITAFADKIGVVDTPVIPVLGLLIVAAGTLLSAGLLAALPRAVAARTAAATALRRE